MQSSEGLTNWQSLWMVITSPSSPSSSSSSSSRMVQQHRETCANNKNTCMLFNYDCIPSSSHGIPWILEVLRKVRSNLRNHVALTVREARPSRLRVLEVGMMVFPFWRYKLLLWEYKGAPSMPPLQEQNLLTGLLPTFIPYKPLIVGRVWNFGISFLMPPAKTVKTKSGWLEIFFGPREYFLSNTWRFWCQSMLVFCRVVILNQLVTYGLCSPKPASYSQPWWFGAKKNLIHHTGWRKWKVSCQKVICDTAKLPVFKFISLDMDFISRVMPTHDSG